MTTRERPILVTGIPRSGTTWAGRMIDAGGRVGYVNEPFNLARDPGTLRVPAVHWFTYVTSENESDILPELSDLLAFRYPLARELVRCRNSTHLKHTLKWWRSYIRSRGLRPLVKEPHAVFSCEWFIRRLDSDAVVLVRHPLSVVSSWKRLEWDFDFANLLDQPALLRDWLNPYSEAMRAAAEPTVGLVDRVALLWEIVYHVVDRQRERLPGLRVVRHEDLARDPLGGFRTLYETLGLPFTPEAKVSIASSSSSDNPEESGTDEPHATMLASSASLDNWRGRLDADEVKRIMRRTSETAARYYPEDVS